MAKAVGSFHLEAVMARMVDRKHIILAALAIDTTMSRAFRLALGLPARICVARSDTVASPWRAEPVDPDLAYCFRNLESPMDVLHG